VFSQESLKKAEGDAIQAANSYIDQYASDKSRIDALKGTLARLDEIASRRSTRIWVLEYMNGSLGSELEKAKPFVERDVQNVARIKELEKEVLIRDGLNSELETELANAKDIRRRFIVGGDELQVDDFFYDLPPLGGDEVADNGVRRNQWIIRHEGYVHLECSMFLNLPVDEVISVKDLDGYYTSYIHISDAKVCKMSEVSCELERIDGVTFYNIVCQKGGFNKSTYFGKIANSLKNRQLDRVKTSTTKPPGAEKYKIFHKYLRWLNAVIF
jgi:hypothetical protein